MRKATTFTMKEWGGRKVTPAVYAALANRAYEREKKEVNFASYPVCPVCSQIMSHRAKKLVKVNENIFVHPGCYSIAARKAHEKATATAKAEVEGVVEDGNAD